MVINETFYKYMSSDTALTVLNDTTLKFSNTLDFNDPFDYNPAFSTIGLSKFIKRVGENKEVKINRKKAMQNCKILTTDEFRREASSEFSVTCFSKSPHIVPMWAHYADCHSGCVLGFANASVEELNNMLVSSQWLWSHDCDFLIPYDVKYTDARPNIFNSEGLTNTRENGFDACVIKAKAWEYEQEVRVIKLKPAGIYPFHLSQLRSIRFGLNIDPLQRKKIIGMVTSITKSNSMKIRLFDVKMDHKNFKFNDVKCS
uniref:DUF2971 domain-containing protein n=1 Tax=Rahnella sp. RFA10(1/100) TaxID=2511202 RepID=UPI00102136A5|nr:DUF2971 domain-containing protein [Rahnella sp. RFA10(1/100)]